MWMSTCGSYRYIIVIVSRQQRSMQRTARQAGGDDYMAGKRCRSPACSWQRSKQVMRGSPMEVAETSVGRHGGDTAASEPVIGGGVCPSSADSWGDESDVGDVLLLSSP
jgi:hypothetical protein